jgi:hypothetical protein
MAESTGREDINDGDGEEGKYIVAEVAQAEVVEQAEEDAEDTAAVDEEVADAAVEGAPSDRDASDGARWSTVAARRPKEGGAAAAVWGTTPLDGV